ncbi:O-antigen polymerase [Novosphingobium sp.]|uniref:O-antigen polymerase n=1 Tax=Novosphingobium sp. TaxID=1874826 RepID=UPI0027333B7E|nr:O-antigen polymerase [Novosphingobium sp.]MDP3906639.1 O-antigen polymerase [Novosphingobium sp.]
MYEAALTLSVISLLGVTLYYVRMPAFSVFHPLSFYLLFHGFIFVFRPVIAHLNDFQFIYRLYQFTPSYEDKLTVILASNLGMIAFAFFSLQAGHNPMRFKQDTFAVAERNRLVATAMWVLAICLPIGAYSLQLTWERATADVSIMVMDAGTGTFINTSGNGYLAEAQLMLATACAMIGWLFRFRLLALMPLAAFVIFRAGTGGRGPFVSAAVCLGLLYLYEHRQRVPSPRVIGLALGLIGLFAVIGLDRGESVRALVSGSEVEQVGLQSDDQKWLEGMDFGNLEYFEYLVYAVPQRTGSYEYFANNLMLFTEPVPRVLWPGKPVGSPIKFFELFDYGFPIGMTRSLPGEGWTQLGWLGVIIWCGLWGLGLGTLYQKFTNGTQTTFAVLGYMVLMSTLVVVFRDGSLVTIMRQGIFYFAPILLWKLLSSQLGVPLAAPLRAVAQRRLRMAKAAAAAAHDPEPSASPGSAMPAAVQIHVPPAVARRRAKLAELKQAHSA